MVARTRDSALQGFPQCCVHSHRVLGCPGLAGPRAEGAGPAGRGRGARRHNSYCARRHCGGGGGCVSSCRSAPPPLWTGGKQARGAVGPGSTGPRPTATLAPQPTPVTHTCDAQRAPCPHAHGPRSSGHRRPRLRSPSSPRRQGPSSD